MAKLSVVIPVYNVEIYIGKMIDSVLSQTLKDLELILVDDGSPDNSGAICDEYAAKDSRVHVIHKKNAGVGAARNDGLAVANSEWIIFCDSDDWLETDALEKLVAAGERAGADVVFGDINVVTETNVRKLRFYNNEFNTSDRDLINKLIAADFSRQYCFDPPAEGPGTFYGGPWNKIVRLQLLKDNDISFDLRVKGLFDDVLYTAYIYAAANRIVYAHVPVYNYRQVENSITHSYKANLVEIDSAIFRSWDEFIEKYAKDGHFDKPYYALVIRRLCNCLGLYFFNDKNEKTLGAQLKELGTLLQTEPYKTAIREADETKLPFLNHQVVLRAARSYSPVKVYLAYKAISLPRWLKAQAKKVRTFAGAGTRHEKPLQN